MSLTQSVSERVRLASSSARLVRASTLRGRRGLSEWRGVRRQLPAQQARQLFAYPPLPWRVQSPAFFRRRIAPAYARRIRPVRRESRTFVRISQLLRDRSCLRIVAHRRVDENNQLARSWAPR